MRLLGCREFVPAGRGDGAGANDVDADPSALQVQYPGAREVADGGLAGAVDAEPRRAVDPAVEAFRMIELPSLSSGSAFWTVKSGPFTLMPNIFVELRFGDLAERGEFDRRRRWRTERRRRPASSLTIA